MQAQRAGEVGIAEDLARLRRARAVEEERLARVGMRAEHLHRAAPARAMISDSGKPFSA